MRIIISISLFLLFTHYSEGQQTKFFRTYGGGYFDVAQSVIQDPDSGYVVAGATASYNVAGSDILLFKIDQQGNQLWMKTIGGSQNDWARRIMLAPGATGYILAGHTNSFGAGAYDAYIVHTDWNGDTLWTRTIGGSDWDFVYGLDTTFDGNIILCGETSSFGNGNRDAWIIKMNMNGDVIWSKTLGGTQDDVANYLFEDRDSNIVVLGSTKSWGLGQRDFYFMKLNASGDTIFTKYYGTEHDEWFTSGDNYIDNGNNLSYCFGGNRYHFAENITIGTLMRVNINGDYMYENSGDPQYLHERKQTIVKNEANGETFYCVFTHSDRNLFNSRFQIEILRSNYGFGTFIYSNNFGSPHHEFTWDVLKTFDKGYVIVGQIENYGPGPTACFVAKTDSVGITVSQSAPVLNLDDELKTNIFSIFPNPAKDMVQFVTNYPIAQNAQIQLLDLNGRQVMMYKTNSLTQNISMDISSLPNGIYLVQLFDEHHFIQRKMIISR